MAMPNTTITGREPHLSTSFGRQGMRRLSILSVGNMLNFLPAEAISIAAYSEALKSDAFYVRYSAAKKLSERPDHDARLLMQDILAHGEAPSRASVVRYLYSFSWFSAEPMLRTALHDTDSRVREAAVYALCDLHELAAYQLLAEVVRVDDDTMKMAAAWGLRDCQDLAALPVLEAVLTAEDPEIRVKGLEALGNSDVPGAIGIVRGALNDPEPDVKYAATLSLIELAGEQYLQELSGMIGRTKGVTLQQILRGFFHATNYLKIDVSQTAAADLMIDALEAALFDDLPDARKAAIWPLAWMHHPRMPTVIRGAYIREKDSEVKAHILRVAVNLATDVGLELLQDALKSSDPQVKRQADKLALVQAEREKTLDT